jgi:hypothetical protein
MSRLASRPARFKISRALVRRATAEIDDQLVGARLLLYPCAGNLLEKTGLLESNNKTWEEETRRSSGSHPTT